jgi:hypothetical protein
MTRSKIECYLCGEEEEKRRERKGTRHEDQRL